MKYKKCVNCGANLDHGEICDCKNQTNPETDLPMSKLALFAWAEANEKIYPALKELKEEKIKETSILKMTVPWGRRKGLVLTFEKTLACALRRRRDYRDYAIGFHCAIKSKRT